MVLRHVTSKIRSLRGVLRRLILMAGAARITLIAVGLAALCLLMDWTFHLSPGWRLSLGLGSLAGILAAVHSFLVRPMFVPMPDDELALLFERRFPELEDVLVSAVQLTRGRGLATSDLVGAVVTDAEDAAEGIRPEQVPKPRKVHLLGLAAGAAVASAVIFSALFPATANLFAARFLNPFGPAEWPRDTTLTVEAAVAGGPESEPRWMDGPEVDVTRGDAITVRVTAQNARDSAVWRPPDAVHIEYGPEGHEQEARPMRRVKDGVYQAYIDDVTAGLTVTAYARGANPASVSVRVVQPPRAEDVWLSVERPRYTGIPREDLGRSATDVSAVEGSAIHVWVRTNTTLEGGSASIITDSGDSTSMRPVPSDEPDRAECQGAFKLVKGMKSFWIKLVDADGVENRSPKTVKLDVLEDEPPGVRIVEPARHIRCTPHAVLPIRALFTDKFGVRSGWLRYRLRPEDPPKNQDLFAFPEDQRQQHKHETTHPWDLADLGVKVGQAISYRVEADDWRDEFPPGSTLTRQIGRSEEYYIKIVSHAQLAGELDRTQLDQRKRLEKARRRQADDRGKVDELLRKMSEGEFAPREDRNTASNIEDIQRELARRVRGIATVIRSVRRQMKYNRIGSFAEGRKLDDVAATLEDVTRSEMPRAADFVNSARKDLASREGKKNLQNASRIQGGILGRLDKVLARMKHNEDIDSLVRLARELLEKQRSVKKGTAEFAKRPGTFGATRDQLKPTDLAALKQLRRRQTSARDDMRDLEQKMSNAFERLKVGDLRRAELVSQAQALASRERIHLMMDEAAAKLHENRIGLAAARQDAAIKGLERLLEMLENAREEDGSDEVLAQVIRDIKEAIEDVGRLRQAQEGHAGDIGEINRDSAQVAGLKQLKRKISRLRKEQDKANRQAKDGADLKPLAGREDKLAEETAGIAGELKKEAKAAAERRAPQAKPIGKAATAAAAAKAGMTAAKAGMQEGDRNKAGRAGEQASQELAEADAQVGKAIDAIEKKRLTDARDTALKQKETSREARRVLEKLRRLAEENEKGSKEASKGLHKAAGKVGEARQSMGGAQSSLDKNDTVQGEQDAQKARDQLAEAQRDLEKLRDKLEKQQKEQKLLDLIVEIEPMLEKQININDEARRIDVAMAERKLSKPERPDEVRLGQLAADESGLANKAGQLLKKVEGENAPVFVWGFRKLVRDMGEMKGRLTACKTDSYTQDLGRDIAQTLRMLIDALKRERQRLGEEGMSGANPRGGGGGKPMLVPPAAQLKLLKARELEIHNSTKRIYGKLIRTGRDRLSPLQRRRVERLAEEQAQLGTLTEKLAESLERAVREHYKKMEEIE